MGKSSPRLRLDDETIETLRHQLLERRRELIRRIADSEEALRIFGEERETEMAEHAQEAALGSIIDRFSERERRELEDVQRALVKITHRELGKCESCSGSIPVKRLVALPTTRFCIGCGRVREAGAPAAVTHRRTRKARPLSPEFQGLSDARIESIVRERFHWMEIDFHRVRLDVDDGRLVVSGQVPTILQRKLLFRTLEDETGLPITDHLDRIPRGRRRTSRSICTEAEKGSGPQSSRGSRMKSH